MTHYSMYSAAGNAEVRKAVEEVLARHQDKQTDEGDAIVDDLLEHMTRIAEEHPEVFDTAVREAMWRHIIAQHPELEDTDV